jgi:metal-responsive CopG/Arc/MetJ family transcriptional regulator
MSRRKTSVSVDDELWREWLSFVVKETGSTRKTSEFIENAIKEYMLKRKEGKK